MNNMIKYNENLNILGGKIKFYREKNNLSLSQLSNKLMLLGIDIPKSSLFKIENGNRIIKDYELAAFTKVFKISPNVLLKDFLKELE